MRIARALIAGLLLCTTVRAESIPDRGIWMWASEQSEHGTTKIVGDPRREDEAIEHLREWRIGRVYGAFKGRPVEQPELVAAWNRKLHAAGIQSQLLLSENTWIFDGPRARFLQLIDERLLAFNAAHKPDERFDGLHLDIEPHGMKQWKTAPPAQRREWLMRLADTFAAARKQMNEHGGASQTLRVDLPAWFDELDAAHDLGWADAADRDRFFAAVAASVTDASLMDYERRNFDSIRRAAQWELAAHPRKFRVGLEADIGKGKTWKSPEELRAMIEHLEAVYGPDVPIDIHAFTQLMEAK